MIIIIRELIRLGWHKQKLQGHLTSATKIHAVTLVREALWSVLCKLVTVWNLLSKKKKIGVFDILRPTLSFLQCLSFFVDSILPICYNVYCCLPLVLLWELHCVICATLCLFVVSELTPIDTFRGMLDFSLIFYTSLIAVSVDIVLTMPHLLFTIYHTQVLLQIHNNNSNNNNNNLLR